MRATLSALSTLSASLGQLVRRRDAARGEVEQGLQADEGAVTAEYAVVIMVRHLAVTEILSRPESHLSPIPRYRRSVSRAAGRRRH